MTRRVIFATLALAAAVGCGKSDSEKATEQAAQAAKQAAQGAQQAAQGAQQAAQGAQQGAQQFAQGLQQMAQGLQGAGGPVKLVDYEELKALLPEVAGWERKTKGEQVSMGVASVSKAEGTYSNGNASMTVEITDSAMSQMFLAPLMMYVASGYSERSDDGYTKSATVGGQPGFEKWEKNSKRAEVTAIVGNRFIVQGTGHDVDNPDVVRKAVESINLSKLASLK